MDLWFSLLSPDCSLSVSLYLVGLIPLGGVLHFYVANTWVDKELAYCLVVYLDPLGVLNRQFLL